jgi:hypothetical protein
MLEVSYNQMVGRNQGTIDHVIIFFIAFRIHRCSLVGKEYGTVKENRKIGFSNNS